MKIPVVSRDVVWAVSVEREVQNIWHTVYALSFIDTVDITVFVKGSGWVKDAAASHVCRWIY